MALQASCMALPCCFTVCMFVCDEERFPKACYRFASVSGKRKWCHGLADRSLPLNTTDLPPDVESFNNVQGIFLRGCQWRDIQHEGQAKKFWAEEEYEYWHGDVKQWKAEMPETCTVRGSPAKDG